MEILLDFKDDTFAIDLAYRFSYLNSNLVINVGTIENNKFDICLTDNSIVTTDEKIIILEHLLDAYYSIYSSSTVLLNQIFDRYRKNTGINLYKTSENSNKIFSFFSNEGGSGVSSISITFARNLALLGKNILYITNTDSYFDGNKNNMKNIIELEYAIYKNKDVDFYKYIDIDITGLNILIINDMSIVFDIISEIRNFDMFVIDYGTFKSCYPNSIMLEIKNYDDIRTNILNSEQNSIVVVNKASINKVDNIHVSYDSFSFKNHDNYIEISLNGNFNNDIINFMKVNKYDKL